MLHASLKEIAAWKIGGYFIARAVTSDYYDLALNSRGLKNSR
jgi:hypothetical protein